MPASGFLNDDLLEGPAAQLGVVVAVRVGEVVDAVEGDGRDHARVRVLEAGLEGGVVLGQAGQRGQVAAGRAAGDRDPRGVDAELGGVLADPGDRALDVDDVLGPGRLRAEPVVDVEADPAEAREVVEQRDALLVAGAGEPAAAVDLDRPRAGARRGIVLRPVDVEPQSQTVLGVEDDAALTGARSVATKVSGGTAHVRERHPPARRRPAAPRARPRRVRGAALGGDRVPELGDEHRAEPTGGDPPEPEPEAAEADQARRAAAAVAARAARRARGTTVAQNQRLTRARRAGGADGRIVAIRCCSRTCAFRNAAASRPGVWGRGSVPWSWAALDRLVHRSAGLASSSRARRSWR